MLVPSTDYRDIRKAAFQEYAVTTHSNAARIPPHTPLHTAASVGVAFVAAAFSLGISFGLDFSGHSHSHSHSHAGSVGIRPEAHGPDLLSLLREVQRVSPGDIPADVRAECFSIADQEEERVRPGDWVAIWGGKHLSFYLSPYITFTITV